MFNFLGFAAQVCVICVSIALIINTHEYICSQDTADEPDATLSIASSACAKVMTSPVITTVIAEFEPYPSDINSMTVKQLMSYAKASGFTGYSALRKAELISLLSEF